MLDIKNKLIFLLFTLLYVFSAKSFAGEYKLLKGQGVEVCEKYTENLSVVARPMICEREIVLEDSKLEEVKFESIDVWENRYFEKKIYEFLSYGVSGLGKMDEDKHFEWVQEWLKYDQLKMAISTIDIDNDGRLDKILKYISGKCLTNYFGTSLIVLNEAGDDLDVERTMRLSQNKFKRAASVGNWEFNSYDVFVYEGKNYFDRWDYDEKNKLYVYQMNGNKSQNICSIEYLR